MTQLRSLESDWRRYCIAVALAVAALGVQSLLNRLLGDHNPYHTLWAAVIVSAWYCGIGPSVVALTIGFLGVWYWFVPPLNSWAIQDPNEINGMVVFLFFSACIIALGESYRRGTAKRLKVVQELQIAQAGLEDRVQKQASDLLAATASLREASGAIDYCLSEVRTISQLLHPPVRDGLGVRSEIKVLGPHESSNPDMASPPNEGVCISDWRRLHQAVLNEKDRNQLLRLVHELETAFVKRTEELSHDLGACEELREMQIALADLLSIKIHKLGWPDPRQPCQ